MRYALYKNFYETLKQFVEDENFTISYEMFGDKYVLAFNKKDKKFYYREGRRTFVKLEDAYKIIKSYVEKLILQKQKDTFNGSFEKTRYEGIVIANEEDKKIFLSLIKQFKDYLWEEPISIYDINTDYLLERIRYGFYNSTVPEHVIEYIISLMLENPKVFDKGIISYYMWKKTVLESYMGDLENFEKEGYIVIKKERFNINVALTKRFYEALKKSIYYDFAPSSASNTAIIRFKED